MKPASAKNKGRKLQQWVCERIAELTGYETGQDCPIESRGMGQNGLDVRLEAAVLKEFPYSVECKNQEKWNLREAVLQVKANVKKGTNWLIFFKSNRVEPVVVIQARHFFKLIERLNKLERK